MIEKGRLCIKTCGRDSGKACVILKKLDENYVLIDGDVRRKKCNIKHLELLNKLIDVKEDSPKEDIKARIHEAYGKE